MSKKLEPFWKRTFAAALGLIFAISLGPAAAQQSDLQSYDVELIVFRHLASDATPEQGSIEAPFGGRMTIPGEEEDPSELDGPAPEAPPDAATATYPPLSTSKFKLTAIEEALRRSRNYRPIAHVGWTQPGYARNTARFLAVDSFVPASSGLTGRIALSRGRYLHLTLDLEYTNPEAAGEPGARQVLKHSRRMRSSERHYIDHPAFGVIAIVTPSGS